MHFVSAVFIFIHAAGYMKPVDVTVQTEAEAEETAATTVLVDVFGNSPEVRLLDFFMDHPLNDYMLKEIAESTGMNK